MKLDDNNSMTDSSDEETKNNPLVLDRRHTEIIIQELDSESPQKKKSTGYPPKFPLLYGHFGKTLVPNKIDYSIKNEGITFVGSPRSKTSSVKTMPLLFPSLSVGQEEAANPNSCKKVDRVEEKSESSSDS